MSWLMFLIAAVSVRVEADRCDIHVDEVKRIAAIELAQGPTAAQVDATLTCRDGQLEVRVDDSATNKTLIRRTPLAALPDNTRDRFVAIAIAELVEASWSELKSIDRHSPTLSQSLYPGAESRGTPRRLRLLVQGSGTFYVLPGVLQGGGLIRAHVLLAGPWGIAVDLQVMHGQSRVAGGRVNLDSLTGAAFFTGRVDSNPLVLQAGLGFRGGGARMLGIPNDVTVSQGASVSGLLAGPAFLAELGFKPGWLELGLGLEVGFPVARLVGLVDGQAATGLTGVWVSMNLGLGMHL